MTSNYNQILKMIFPSSSEIWWAWKLQKMKFSITCHQIFVAKLLNNVDSVIKSLKIKIFVNDIIPDKTRAALEDLRFFKKYLR